MNETKIRETIQIVRALRASAVIDARVDLRRSRAFGTDWLQGFYKGWAGGHYIEARSLRRVQKRLEALVG